MSGKTLLAISSDVGFGAVGLSLMRFVFASEGVRQICLPSVVFASRPDLGVAAAHIVPADALLRAFNGLERDGWFSKIDGVITGYFANSEQIDCTGDCIKRIKEQNPDLIYLLDPVFGDEDKGLYVDLEVAQQINNQLMPLADIAVPNRFEFNWLCERAGVDRGDVISFSKELKCDAIVVTSALIKRGVDPAQIQTLLLNDGVAERFDARYFEHVPKGTGDLFAALMICRLLKGEELSLVVGKCTAYLEAITEKAQCCDAFEPFLIFNPN